MSRWTKNDALRQAIRPGDVCAYSYKAKVELVVYIGESWGGPNAVGDYGKFQTIRGIRSIKYNSVLFAFDPMSDRRAQHPETVKLIKQFYEGNK